MPDDIQQLRTYSSMLQWVSIGLVFISGFMQLGRNVIDRKVHRLEAIARAERANPLALPILTATGTLSMITDAPDQQSAHFMDQGGFFAFMQGDKPLMILRSQDCIANALGNGQVQWSSEISLPTHDSSVGHPLQSLMEADRAIYGFVPIAPNSRMSGGKAVLIINSTVRIDVFFQQVPMSDKYYEVKDLSPVKKQLEDTKKQAMANN